MKFQLYSSLILFCFGFQISVLSQQLTYNNPLLTNDFSLNPALTASGEFVDAGVVYRQQWVGFESAPRTAMLYAQYPLVYQNMSIGGYLVHDEAGLIDADELAVAYSYKINPGWISNDQLSIGISANVRQVRFDGTNAISGSENDVLLSNEKSSTTNPNFGAGVYYMSDRDMYLNEENTFFAGVGFSQLMALQHDLSNNIPYQKQLHGNALFGGRFVQGLVFFEPSLNLNFVKNSPMFATISVLMEMEETFWTGLAYQTDNTVAFQAGILLKIKDGILRIGARSGYNIGPTGKERGLGYEFVAAYQFEL